ncbi:hypothetical protein Tco_0358246, partial [Tanacetum coccineum]
KEETKGEVKIEDKEEESTRKRKQVKKKMMKRLRDADLKSKKFEDIQALYEKIKRFNEDFISTRSAQDERFTLFIQAGLSKSEKIKEETKGEVKIEDKEE